MREPTRTDDGWALESGVAHHNAAPDTFWIPSRRQRQGLRVGDSAKLIFDVAGLHGGAHWADFERMWVYVTERVGSTYIGVLDNDPATYEATDATYLVAGAEVPFRAEHVIDIARPTQAQDVPEYAIRPTRIWPRGRAASKRGFAGWLRRPGALNRA